MLPQTRHSDALLVLSPWWCAVRMMEVVPMNYQAKHRLSASWTAATVFVSSTPAVLHEWRLPSATQLSPSLPQQEGGRQKPPPVPTPRQLQAWPKGTPLLANSPSMPQSPSRRTM